MKALISNRLLRVIQIKEKPYEIRDTRLKGFILRVQPSGSMSYIVEYGRGKRITLGRADRLTTVQARDHAREKLAEAALGGDPKRDIPKVYKLSDFLNEIYQPWMETSHAYEQWH